MGGDIANSLAKCLEGREKSLLEIKVFLAGAWVDLRARVFLSEEQKVVSKRQLLLLNQRVKERMGEEPAVDAREEETTLDEDPDDFDTLINNLAGSQNSDQDDAEETETDEFNISLLEVEKVRHLKERDIWSQILKFPVQIQPVLRLACALPSTQVSVERNFSPLKLLRDIRAKMGLDLANSLLFLRVNKCV